MRDARLRFIFGLVEEGKVELVDSPAQQGLVCHQHYTAYPDPEDAYFGAEVTTGSDSYTSGEESICIASSYPYEVCISHQEQKFEGTIPTHYVGEFPDRHLVDSRRFDVATALVLVEGVVEACTFERYQQLCDMLKEKYGSFIPEDCGVEWIGAARPPEKYLKFRDEQVWKEFCEYEHEIDDGHCTFYTPAEHEAYLKAQEEKEKRKLFAEMNEWTKNFAEKHGIEPLSIEFLDAVDEHFEVIDEAWEDRLVGMQEDGLCIGFGVTSEQWYDERNHVQMDRYGDRALAEKVFSFIKDNMPLLYGQWSESRNKRAIA